MVYAEYVITCVLSIIMVVVGLITAFLISVIAMEDISDVTAIVNQLDYRIVSLLSESNIVQKAPGLFFAVFFVGATLIILIPNLIWRIKIHYFLKSAHQSIDDKYVKIEYAKEARNAIIILCGISLVSNIILYSTAFVLFCHLFGTAAGILTAILINKYFVSEK